MRLERAFWWCKQLKSWNWLPEDVWCLPCSSSLRPGKGRMCQNWQSWSFFWQRDGPQLLRSLLASCICDAEPLLHAVTCIKASKQPCTWCWTLVALNQSQVPWEALLCTIFSLWVMHVLFWGCFSLPKGQYSSLSKPFCLWHYTSSFLYAISERGRAAKESHFFSGV